MGGDTGWRRGGRLSSLPQDRVQYSKGNLSANHWTDGGGGHRMKTVLQEEEEGRILRCTIVIGGSRVGDTARTSRDDRYVANPTPCFHMSPAWEGSLVHCSARMQRLSLFCCAVSVAAARPHSERAYWVVWKRN